MATIYENLYIGSFILALGYKLGQVAEDSDPLAGVNLYQQTPGDPLLGDLVTHLTGKTTLLEFKRDRKGIKEELHKDISVKWLDGIQGADRHLSERCHFLSFPEPLGGGQVDLRFCPYLALPTFLPLGEQKTLKTKYFEFDGSPEPKECQDFIDGLVEGTIGVAPDEFQSYIHLLDGLSGGGGGGKGALLVNFGDDSNCRLIAFETLSDLLKKAEDAAPPAKKHVLTKTAGQ